jgi:hypothetical protein
MQYQIFTIAIDITDTITNTTVVTPPYLLNINS